MQKINSWRSGAGKWKKIARELFRIQILKPHLIRLAGGHIRDTTYIAKSMARVMDLCH
jgi:hypothetical protein